MLLGRVSAPLPATDVTRAALASWPSDHRVVVLRAPAGGVPAHRLASELETTWGVPSWIRLAPHDLDATTVAPLFARADDAARSSTPDGTSDGASHVYVIEGLDCLGKRDIGTYVVDRALSSGRSVVIVATRAIGPDSAIAELPVCEPHPLSVDEIGEICTASGTNLSPRRLHALTSGRAAVVDAVIRASPMAGTALAPLVERSRTHGELLVAMASGIAHSLPASESRALGLACVLGYGHARLSSVKPAMTALDRPWWVPLRGSWTLVNPMWRAPLIDALKDTHTFAGVSQLAVELVDDDAVSEAIEFCLDAGFPGMAADVLGRFSAAMVHEGRAAMVERWIERLAAAGIDGAATNGVGLRSDPTTRRHRTGATADGCATTLASPKRSWWRPFRKAAARPPLAAQYLESQQLPVPTIEPDERDAPEAQSKERMSPPLRTRPPLVEIDSAPETSTFSDTARSARVEIRLFGEMSVSAKGGDVGRWRGTRGRLVLAYLLLNRERPTSSERLAAAFWPDAPPKASRNRLHVAINGLRNDLATITDLPVVLYRRGYLINPDIDVEVDVERFEALVDEARQVAAAKSQVAIDALERAVRLYRGSLLNDTPYEDWLFGPREHFHVAMLQALDRFVALLFDAMRYAECLQGCERLLSEDLCREDIHRLAMRCYVRLGQPHLAVRQFQACRRQLRHELGLAPDQVTEELADKIRRRQPI